MEHLSFLICIFLRFDWTINSWTLWKQSRQLYIFLKPSANLKVRVWRDLDGSKNVSVRKFTQGNQQPFYQTESRKDDSCFCLFILPKRLIARNSRIFRFYYYYYGIQTLDLDCMETSHVCRLAVLVCLFFALIHPLWLNFFADNLCREQKTEIHSAWRHWWEPAPRCIWRQAVISSYPRRLANWFVG